MRRRSRSREQSLPGLAPARRPPTGPEPAEVLLLDQPFRCQTCLRKGPDGWQDCNLCNRQEPPGFITVIQNGAVYGWSQSNCRYERLGLIERKAP